MGALKPEKRWRGCLEVSLKLRIIDVRGAEDVDRAFEQARRHAHDYVVMFRRAADYVDTHLPAVVKSRI